MQEDANLVSRLRKIDKALSNELLISSTPQGDRIALLEERRLIEYHLEAIENTFSVGDIYLGTVRKVNPGMNAVFVDIGHEKDAFLHYLDLGPQIKSLTKWTNLTRNGQETPALLEGFKQEEDIEKTGKIGDVLQKGQQILVQVVKEPISTKGPRLSSELSLAGRYLVLVPFSEIVTISKRIVRKEERSRLINFIKEIKPAKFGVIIRTVAEDRELDELQRDLEQLVEKWKAGHQALITANVRDKVIGELSRSSAIVRDMLNENFDTISTDSKEIYEDLKRYLRSIAPDKEHILKLYQGKSKFFESAGIERQLKTLFGKTVSLPGGGYLVVEHTEALHVIDVNSGSTNAKSAEDQESTALQVNLEAAKEVARQLRLRDMGGIIVIDFIDMRKLDNKKEVYERMKEEMKSEKAKFTILPLSKFGLMQITRQRVRPQMDVVTSEICPSCNGTGKISASLLVAETIEQSVELLLVRQNEKGIKVHVHPFLFAYFTKGIWSKQMAWWWKFKSWVNMVEDSTLGILEFKFFNKANEPIELGGVPKSDPNTADKSQYASTE